eukprot:Gb_06467 [translate_table: standard]
MARAAASCCLWGERAFIIHNYDQGHRFTANTAIGNAQRCNSKPCTWRGLNSVPKDAQSRPKQRSFHVVAATEGSAKSTPSDEKIPSWAKPDSDESPPWARNEGKGQTNDAAEQAFQIPFYVYLLASAIVAIAAVNVFLPSFILTVWKLNCYTPSGKVY